MSSTLLLAVRYILVFIEIMIQS